jgi:hypothetical protein
MELELTRVVSASQFSGSYGEPASPRPTTLDAGGGDDLDVVDGEVPPRVDPNNSRIADLISAECQGQACPRALAFLLDEEFHQIMVIDAPDAVIGAAVLPNDVPKIRLDLTRVERMLQRPLPQFHAAIVAVRVEDLIPAPIQ